jgi:tRNA A37 threonylcarbamoyladenosine modification protein TsaB
MTVAFDTTEPGVVRVRFDGKGAVVRRTLKMFADGLLKKLVAPDFKNKVTAIAVVNGPGAFSATRNGVAMGNALAYGLGVPIVAVTKEQFSANDPLPAGGGESVAVVYGAPPTITKKKLK